LGEVTVRRLALVLVTLVAMLAACSPASGGNDPYALAFNASKGGWDQVQVDLTVSAQMGSGSVSLQPGAIRLVLDTKAGKGLFHVSVPTSTLGIDAASLTQFGITGDTINLDVLYDGQALYAKSPIAPALVQLLYSSGGQAPSGDLTGWLKLATSADFAALAALGGSVAAPSAAPMASFADANAMKTALTAMGVTLAYVATEQHNGVNADHITATVDWQKLAASPQFQSSTSQAQVQQAITALEGTNSSIDLWVDHSAGRIVGLEVKGASKTDATQTFDIALGFKTPDAGQSLDTPSGAVDVPLIQLLGPLLQGVLGGGGVTP